MKGMALGTDRPHHDPCSPHGFLIMKIAIKQQSFAMTKELTNCTLNVRGFRNKLKRKATYKYIREHNIDIACFQETYITSDIVADIERE